jgi:threonine synthase
MTLYSTNNKNHLVDLKTAVMTSLAPDKGLYMPTVIPQLEVDFLDNLPEYSFAELSSIVAQNIIGDVVPKNDVESIVDKAINFKAPVIMLNDKIGSLELWHGPSMAFKDFGARFMAGLMSYFLRDEDHKTTILVATSGDTGGAVAAGFYDVPGIDVIILYPSGKVSEIQEKQLTTLGKNISACEISGTFDDCQALVKEAFLDPDLNKEFSLSSANSINIARLIPQSFYYFEAFKQVQRYDKKVVVSVPSGNFGNLTAGLLAKSMGLSIHRFIAATNINKIVPDYLESGLFIPKPSIATISNAMDVGNPSNFVRMLELYNHDLTSLKRDVTGFWLDDINTKSALLEAYKNDDYICDPHGAIGYKSLQGISDDELGVFLETAHPAKFLDVMDDALGERINIPDELSNLLSKEKVSHKMSNDFDTFKTWLLDQK